MKRSTCARRWVHSASAISKPRVSGGDAVRVEQGGDLLREALVLERRDREVHRETGGLRVPGGAVRREPPEQSLQDQRVEGGRIALHGGAAGEHLEAAGLAAGAQLRERQQLEDQVRIVHRPRRSLRAATMLSTAGAGSGAGAATGAGTTLGAAARRAAGAVTVPAVAWRYRRRDGLRRQAGDRASGAALGQPGGVRPTAGAAAAARGRRCRGARRGRRSAFG